MNREEFVQAAAQMAGQVWDFHERWSLEDRWPGGRPPAEAMADRRPLIEEELQELREAVESGDAAHICEEAADVLFVALGNVKSMGSAGAEGVRRVTEKNARKTTETHVIHPDTGKVTARYKLAR